MKALELHQYLQSLCEIRKPHPVDGILFGDPDTEVRKVATCWLPYVDTLREAQALGANVVVCHEPLLYCHWGWDDPANDVKRICREKELPGALAAYQQAVDEKLAWLARSGMVVIRCHDVLDKVPGFGVPFGFAKLLGYAPERRVKAVDYLQLFEIEPVPALAEAQRIADCLKPLHQRSLMFYGEGDRVVRRVAIGTGCCSEPLELMELGAEFCVTITDVLRTWIQGAYARDTGFPTAVVDHGASEEGGVRLLCEHLRDALGLPCVHLPQGAGYQTVLAR